ncbi:hypothetical protein GGR04_004017 [Aureimonas pseudogalii]|uniref:Uncharacterized protein n=1 Tax=Aureimonas pseudogalii TaxID=1744844 RepID=A0A7W6H7S9_9HYPH|nr:hypothetical protein [Aureimonas pseudogalii]
MGQTAYADGPRVRPDRVVEDSRCPVDVQCVHAGRLIVRVTVIGGGWEKVLDLTLGAPVPVADGQLTLTRASPDRTARNGARESMPYRFTFLFQGGR